MKNSTDATSGWLDCLSRQIRHSGISSFDPYIALRLCVKTMTIGDFISTFHFVKMGGKVFSHPIRVNPHPIRLNIIAFSSFSILPRDAPEPDKTIKIFQRQIFLAAYQRAMVLRFTLKNLASSVTVKQSFLLNSSCRFLFTFRCGFRKIIFSLKPLKAPRRPRNETVSW